MTVVAPAPASAPEARVEETAPVASQFVQYLFLKVDSAWRRLDNDLLELRSTSRLRSSVEAPPRRVHFEKQVLHELGSDRCGLFDARFGRGSRGGGYGSHATLDS